MTKALLYARVSTDEQARSGYSLAHEIEALRAHAAHGGYEVLEEVEDAGFSGASLERPGLDRVRDLVAGGDVSVVLAQDRDRFAREPAYLFLLREEFALKGCVLRALNDRGDAAPEGQLTDGIMDQLARFERLKIAERTRRGLLRRVREGHVIRRSKAPFGFDYSEDGRGLVVREEEMAVMRRLFRELAQGRTAGRVVRGFGSDGIASPSGGSRWNTRTLANLLESDLYLPRPAGEVAALVDPQAAATLDAEKVYGLWEFGRRETRRCKERDDLTGIFDPGVYLPDVLEDGPDVLTEHPRERYETVVTAGSNPTTVG
jgi:site-specific DNA recombinase